MAFLVLFAFAPVLMAHDYRDQPCKTAANATSCTQVHGKLWAGDGTPSTRLWPTGSHHIFSIYSNRYGFTHDSETLDNEAPELHFTRPKSMPDQGGWTVYGDFEVCPLEPLIQGHMQAACIAGAHHILVPKQ
jgi:hypothetical protein